jgi:hypothetical protein
MEFDTSTKMLAVIGGVMVCILKKCHHRELSSVEEVLTQMNVCRARRRQYGNWDGPMRKRHYQKRRSNKPRLRSHRPPESRPI